MKDCKRFDFVKKKLILLMSFFLTACGYSFVDQGNCPTISINFIDGDSHGVLTSEIIHALTTCGVFSYRSYNADLELRAKIVDSQNNKIGYRHDVGRSGEVQNNISPVEGRLRMKLEVSIFDNVAQEIVWGPKIIIEEVDFDYSNSASLSDLFIQNGNNRESILTFSLGQLESDMDASDSASGFLYKKISKKIVDIISNEW